jgi:virulence-associated protein VapD
MENKIFESFKDYINESNDDQIYAKMHKKAYTSMKNVMGKLGFTFVDVSSSLYVNPDKQFTSFLKAFDKDLGNHLTLQIVVDGIADDKDHYYNIHGGLFKNSDRTGIGKLFNKEKLLKSIEETGNIDYDKNFTKKLEDYAKKALKEVEE